MPPNDETESPNKAALAMKLTLLILLACAGTFGSRSYGAASGETRDRSPAPFAIPTFHCLGLYWSPPGGAGDKPVMVRYRLRY